VKGLSVRLLPEKEIPDRAENVQRSHFSVLVQFENR